MYSWVTVTIATTMLDNAGSLMEDACWLCDGAVQEVWSRPAGRCWNRWGALVADGSARAQGEVVG